MIADLILRAIDTHAQWPRPRSQNAKRQGGSALAARRQLLINLGSRRIRRASLTSLIPPAALRASLYHTFSSTHLPSWLLFCGLWPKRCRLPGSFVKCSTYHNPAFFAFRIPASIFENLKFKILPPAPFRRCATLLSHVIVDTIWVSAAVFFLAFAWCTVACGLCAE